MSIISIAAADLQTHTTCPASVALANLMQVHNLPPAAHLYIGTGRDDRPVMAIALDETTAEQWRAATGAPAYTRTANQHYDSHRTEVFWFGMNVTLRYTTY